MIEAGEMLLLQRLHDGRSKRDRAGLDRVARVLAALDQNFRKDRERVFDKFAAELFEVRLYESIVDFVQRPRELFAVTTSPLAAANETTDLPTREMDLAANRFSIVGMLLDQCNKDFVSERPGCPSFGSGRMLMCFSTTPRLSSISFVRVRAIFWS
jgi:hypothetical protein